MRDIEEKAVLKYAQMVSAVSAQDRRDSSKLVRAPPAPLRLRTLKSSTRVLIKSFLGCLRNSDELSAVSGTEWKRVLKVDGPICRWPGIDGRARSPVKLSCALLTQHIHCPASAPQRPYSFQPLHTHHTFFNVSTRQSRS